LKEVAVAVAAAAVVVAAAVAAAVVAVVDVVVAAEQTGEEAVGVADSRDVHRRLCHHSVVDHQMDCLRQCFLQHEAEDNQDSVHWGSHP
jgi:hypothetical protein